MMKPTIPYKAYPRTSFIAGIAAVLIATSQFSAAKKVDPLVTGAVSSASTADIEEIVVIGIDAGVQIAGDTITLSSSNVSALVGGLAKAIVAKRGGNLIDDRNRLENKIDEIGEVAAYMLASISGNTKVTSNLGQAKKYAIAVMKSALKGAIKKAEFLNSDFIADVVGSVAQTIHADSRYDVLEVKLQNSLLQQAAKIAGKGNKGAVVKALNTGFASDSQTSGLEDGNFPPVAFIADPETDFRNG